MGRGRRKLSRKRKTGFWEIILIVAIVLIVVALCILFYVANSKNKTLDQDTLCPTTGVEEKTAILIDRTDPLTDIQQQELKVYLNDIKKSIPLHAAISIYEMDKAKLGRIEPEIFLCNPGNGKDKSPWLSNPSLVKKVWQEKFSNRLDVIITRMMEPLEVPNSPIMEAVKAVSVTEFIGEENKGVLKHLIIVSDMMQHTPIYSHYRGSSNFSSYKASKAFEQHLSNLEGVDVEIFYIRRAKLTTVQGKKHIQFWQQYIHAMGGTLNRVVSIN